MPRVPGPVTAGLLALALAVAACGGSAASPATSPASPGASQPPILREDFGSTLVATADGQRLGLWHYRIAPGAKLVPHHHPGYQVARITAGTLTYSIIKGEALVIRANGATETHAAPEILTLQTGDTVVENPDLQHFGANDGTDEVEIYTSTLFTDGEAPAIPVETPSPTP